MSRCYKGQVLLLAVFSLSLAGCEGIKWLTIYNRTGSTMTIQTATLTGDSTQRIIPSDGSFVLVKEFTWLFFNSKIREGDLRTDYLRISTVHDTITAYSRGEIIGLIKNEKTKFNKRTDKDFAYDNNRFVEAIVIRR